MAEEVAAGDALDGDRRRASCMIEGDEEGARLSREDDRTARDRIECDVMAAIGQLDGVQNFAGFRQDRRAIGSVAALVGGSEDGIRRERVGEGGRRERGEEGRARGLEEIAAIDEGTRVFRACSQSPSSEEKPAVSPSAPDICVPKMSDRLEVTRPK